MLKCKGEGNGKGRRCHTLKEA